MKNLAVLFIFSVGWLSHCKPTYTDNGSHLKWMDSYKDPLLSKVADSLKHLIPILDSVLRTDQRYRVVGDPAVFQRNFKKQQELDVINLKKVTGIIDTFGWLNIKDIGMIGSRAINMVMIHSNVETKLKYYPKIIQAFRQGKIFSESVALYEDKMNLMLKRRQFYGSQITRYQDHSVVSPLVDAAKIDSIRNGIGLSPLRIYLTYFGNPDLDMKIYKTNLAEIINLYKINDSLPIHTDLQHIMDSLKYSRPLMTDSTGSPLRR